MRGLSECIYFVQLKPLHPYMYGRALGGYVFLLVSYPCSWPKASQSFLWGDDQLWTEIATASRNTHTRVHAHPTPVHSPWSIGVGIRAQRAPRKARL